MTDQNQVVTDSGEVTDLTVQDEFSGSALTPEQFEAETKRLEDIEKIKIEDKPEAGVIYWEADQGKSFRGIFKGWTMMTPKDRPPFPAAVVKVSPYLHYMSAALKFVDAFQSVPIGKAVYVECTSAKKGETAQFKVVILD